MINIPGTTSSYKTYADRCEWISKEILENLNNVFIKKGSLECSWEFQKENLWFWKIRLLKISIISVLNYNLKSWETRQRGKKT